jgi:glyoxylase-like metal-dependent hydrolase (beta-lactamase superfamily II)
VTQKVSDHVYVIPDFDVPLVPNIGIIVGGNATLVVDTGLGARNGETVLREVRKITSNPNLYLATTHVHAEHDLGAGAFPASTKMIRSEAQVKEIAATGLDLANRFASFSPLNAELLKGAEFRKADITFTDEYLLDLGGGVRVRLQAVGPNHTEGDTIFFVEPDRVLFSGDDVMKGLPAFAGERATVTHWLATLDRLDRLQPLRIVPSHGVMGDRSFIDAYRTYLREVQSRVANYKKQGKTLAETQQAVVADLQRTYPDTMRLNGAIRAAYNETP